MIYLDNNASTPLAPEAWRAMEDAADLYGNPSSVHAAGQAARRRLEEARDDVAALVGARPTRSPSSERSEPSAGPGGS
jgi:cysteine desulfurase